MRVCFTTAVTITRRIVRINSFIIMLRLVKFTTLQFTVISNRALVIQFNRNKTIFSLNLEYLPINFHILIQTVSLLHNHFATTVRFIEKYKLIENLLHIMKSIKNLLHVIILCAYIFSN